jgi:hypothetical protein
MRKIFLTIDTECHYIEKENQYIWGIKGSGKYGIEKIMDIANEFQIPLNFFVEIAEAKRYGDTFVQKIIDTIQMKGHNVYLHLHPNYTSGDDSKTFLWQYSYDEQKEILKQGFDDYFKFTGKKECIAFRIGRYGANENMYKALNELNISTIDLSYSCILPKYCQLSYDQIGTYNIPKKYYNQYIIPNTRYVGFDYFGIKKIFNCDVAESNYGEFVDVLKNISQQNVILTMHSWDLIKKFFFLKNYIAGNYATIRKFKKMILFAQKRGYVFSDLERDFNKEIIGEKDLLYNPVKESYFNKIRYLFYNFVRLQKIARISKKYFLLFSIFYAIIIVILFLTIYYLLHR